jgi:flagellar hook-associated protein 2
MASTSIGGLVSGLDTGSIISQLMQLEARPQLNLKARVSAEQRAVTALQTLNSKLAGIATKAADLAKLANWSPMKATSDNDKVTVTASSDATPGSLTFDVVKTATASRSVYTDKLEATATATASSTLTIDHADATKADVTLTLTDTTLQGVADALNDPANNTGLKATLVRAGGTDTNPTYQLHVESAVTGAASGFTIDDGTGAFLGGVTLTAGVDAELLVNGQTLTSSTNTITDLMPGVDVTLTAGATGSATITIAQDAASLSDKVKGMVDAVNSALSEISTLTASSADVKSRGLLAGDSTLRTVRNRLLESVTGGIGGESLAAYGIQTNREGQLVFDAAKFTDQYATDPEGTAAMFAGPVGGGTVTGLAAKLESLSKTFSDKVDGTVTTAIKGGQAIIKGWEDDIADWDVRLAARRNALERQYTALESALGKLQSQGNWLAGQLASLPQMSSGR